MIQEREFSPVLLSMMVEKMRYGGEEVIDPSSILSMSNEQMKDEALQFHFEHPEQLWVAGSVKESGSTDQKNRLRHVMEMLAATSNKMLMSWVRDWSVGSEAGRNFKTACVLGDEEMHRIFPGDSPEYRRQVKYHRDDILETFGSVIGNRIDGEEMIFQTPEHENPIHNVIDSFQRSIRREGQRPESEKNDDPPLFAISGGTMLHVMKTLFPVERAYPGLTVHGISQYLSEALFKPEVYDLRFGSRMRDGRDSSRYDWKRPKPNFLKTLRKLEKRDRRSHDLTNAERELMVDMRDKSDELRKNAKKLEAIFYHLDDDIGVHTYSSDVDVFLSVDTMTARRMVRQAKDDLVSAGYEETELELRRAHWTNNLWIYELRIPRSDGKVQAIEILVNPTDYVDSPFGKVNRKGLGAHIDGDMSLLQSSRIIGDGKKLYYVDLMGASQVEPGRICLNPVFSMADPGHNLVSFIYFMGMNSLSGGVNLIKTDAYTAEMVHGSIKNSVRRMQNGSVSRPDPMALAYYFVHLGNKVLKAEKGRRLIDPDIRKGQIVKSFNSVMEQIGAYDLAREVIGDDLMRELFENVAEVYPDLVRVNYSAGDQLGMNGGSLLRRARQGLDKNEMTSKFVEAAEKNSVEGIKLLAENPQVLVNV